jgi:hypothetical protein
MTWVLENVVAILEALGLIIGGFAVLATLTSNQSDNKIVDLALKGINLLGANFGEAKNK